MKFNILCVKLTYSFSKFNLWFFKYTRQCIGDGHRTRRDRFMTENQFMTSRNRGFSKTLGSRESYSARLPSLLSTPTPLSWYSALLIQNASLSFITSARTAPPMNTMSFRRGGSSIRILNFWKKNEKQWQKIEKGRYNVLHKKEMYEIVVLQSRDRFATSVPQHYKSFPLPIHTSYQKYFNATTGRYYIH